jgi:hypothetical protein
VKNKRLFLLTFGLFLAIALLSYGILIKQFIETGFIGSVICLSCIGIF